MFRLPYWSVYAKMSGRTTFSGRPNFVDELRSSSYASMTFIDRRTTTGRSFAQCQTWVAGTGTDAKSVGPTGSRGEWTSCLTNMNRRHTTELADDARSRLS